MPVKQLAESTRSKSSTPQESAGRSDQRLLERIDEALVDFIGVPRRDITISATGGHVILQGTVDSYYRKQLAQAAVMSVDGVESIHNEITVVGDDPSSTRVS